MNFTNIKNKCGGVTPPHKLHFTNSTMPVDKIKKIKIYSLRYSSTASAASLPSRIAHTTRL